MTETVLVVDDDKPSGEAMLWAMEAMGHKVCVVSDGRSAIHASQKFVPDIVLCDIKMPGMSGYEVCETMRKDARFAHTLFIAQTGLDSPQIIQRSLQSGFKYYMVKPVDINALLEIVYLERSKKSA